MKGPHEVNVYVSCDAHRIVIAMDLIPIYFEFEVNDQSGATNLKSEAVAIVRDVDGHAPQHKNGMEKTKLRVVKVSGIRLPSRRIKINRELERMKGMRARI